MYKIISFFFTSRWCYVLLYVRTRLPDLEVSLKDYASYFIDEQTEGH